LRVVLDSKLRMPLDSYLAHSASGEVLLFCGAEAEAHRAAALEAAGVEVVRVEGQSGRLDLGIVLDVLGQRKILSVLLECGSELNGAFLAQGLVDKVALFYSETELGEGAVPFAAGGATPFLLEQSMKHVTRTMFGADVRVAGYLRDSWSWLGDALG
jgi:diaminohydroxyphosphoribosylaminopyrimidine deaminase/5-amino-6-(5-phosphoribosylamino)uracil reductase